MRPNTRIAVVGYGYWGIRHVRVLSSMPGVDVTVVDSSLKRLAEAAAHYPNARLVTELDGILGDLEAVVVATPPSTHFALALSALNSGVHVLVEKPLATTVHDAEALVEAASGNRLMVGHTFMYNPAVRRLREIIDSGILGRILYIDAARLNLGLYQSDVNVIWDLAPHDISIATYLLDEVPMSTSVWASRHVGRGHPDVAYLRLDFPTTRAFVHVSWLSPNKVRRTTVVGDQKMAVYDDMSDNERIRIYDIGVDPAEVDSAPATGDMPVTYRTGDITSPYVEFREPLLVEDLHFVDCVRTLARPDTPGERGLDVVRVLAATDRALATGQTASVFGPSDHAKLAIPGNRAAS